MRVHTCSPTQEARAGQAGQILHLLGKGEPPLETPMEPSAEPDALPRKYAVALAAGVFVVAAAWFAWRQLARSPYD